LPNPADPLQTHLLADQREALQNIDIAFEALRSVWTGAEARPITSADTPSVTASHPALDWLDALRQNWTLDSIMFRHALRMALVGAVDVILIRALDIPHGFWLAMTSIIVLQPY